MVSNLKIGKIEKNIGINWSGVFDVITHASTQIGAAAMTGVVPSAGDAANLIIAAKNSIKIDESTESKALRLVLLCFAQAIDDMVPKTSTKGQRQAAREAIANAKDKIDAQDYFLEPEFFNYPISLPLYRDLHDDFIEALGLLRLGESDISGKLDAAFNSALFKLNNEFHELVRPLELIVRSDAGGVAELEANWEIYRNELITKFELIPVFGQEESKISLSDIYIEPRAMWKKKVEDEKLKHDQEHYFFALKEDMWQWVKLANEGSCIRLVRGGPGSGKSSFAKSFSAELAANHKYRPLLIELQHLPKGGSLLEQVRQWLMLHTNYFKQDPLSLSNQHEKRPLVIIFDGLDELVIPDSSGAKAVAEEFLDKLHILIKELSGPEGAVLKVIITGRDAVIKAAESSRGRIQIAAEDALHILGYSKVEEIKGDNLLERFSDNFDRKNQRSKWWGKYSQLKGIKCDLPEPFTRESLDELSCEPLLCYLMALSLNDEGKFDDEIININQVYDKILKDVYNRTWGDQLSKENARLSKEQKANERRAGATGKFDSFDDFSRVLEYVAVAAWRDGESRTAKYDNFLKAIKGTKVDKLWANFNNGYEGSENTEGFATLALTFFFKTEELASKGFEFTHKSFGEYLAAKCLVRFLDENIDSYSNISDASDLEKWVRLACQSTLTKEIAVFIKNEIELKPIVELEPFVEALINVMQLVFDEGLPVNRGDDTWRTAEQRVLNGETTLYLIVAISISELYRKKSIVEKGSTDLIAFPSPANRFVLVQYWDWMRTVGLSSMIQHSGQDLSNGGIDDFEVAFLSRVNFSNSNLSRCSFFQCSLQSSNFSNANISVCMFNLSDCGATNFNQADVESSSFFMSALDNASFEKAILTETNFSHAMAEYCNFRFTICDKTNFDGADLKRAKFHASDLEGALNLTQEQIDSADGDIFTKLPKGIIRPKHWLEDDE